MALSKTRGLVVLLVALAPVLLSGCLPPAGQGLPAASSETAGITVEGEGKAAGVRDRAEVRLSVEARAATSSEATGRLNSAREDLSRRLSDLGLDPKDLVPQQINIWEAVLPPSTPVPSPTPSQWRAFRSVSISVAPSPRGVDLASELVAAGVPSVQTINYLEDRVEARFSVDATAGSAGDAQAEITRKTDSVLQALIAKGFNVLETKVTQAGLSPLPLRPEESQVRVFVARQSMSVSVANLDLMPRLTEAVSPIWKMESIAFGVSNPESLLSQARQAALADAQRKAREIASQTGRELGRVTNVVELYSSAPAAVGTPFAIQGVLTWIPPGGPGQPPGQGFDAGVRLRVTYSIR